VVNEPKAVAAGIGGSQEFGRLGSPASGVAVVDESLANRESMQMRHYLSSKKESQEFEQSG